MNKIKKKLNQIKTKNNFFQISTIIDKKPEEFEVIDKLKIINKNIYAYLFDKTIHVYDCISFKEISKITFPFVTKYLEITEKTIVAYADAKLYFYEYNIKENKLNLIRILSKIFHFCYLKKRKEIILLTENKKPEGLAKADIFGNILNFNKTKPETSYEYIQPKPIDTQDILWCMTSSRYPIHFSEFNGFNNDKYFILIYGYTHNWYKIDENYHIYVFNSDNLDLLLYEYHETDFRYQKITDNLFKKLYGNEKLFYYSPRKNRIRYIDKIYNGDYFYLKDNIFGVLTVKNVLYIVDLSENYITRKLYLGNIFNQENRVDPISNLCYYKLNGNIHLYYTVDGKKHDNEKYKIESKIVHGIII